MVYGKENGIKNDMHVNYLVEGWKESEIRRREGR